MEERLRLRVDVGAASWDSGAVAVAEVVDAAAKAARFAAALVKTPGVTFISGMDLLISGFFTARSMRTFFALRNNSREGASLDSACLTGCFFADLGARGAALIIIASFAPWSKKVFP